MRNGTEILKYVNPIRWAAHAVSRSPSIGNSIVEACLWVERAGVPSSYRLPATAREYAGFQNNQEMIVALAACVGDPRVAPIPPLWPLLALLLLRCRETLSARQVVGRAGELDAEDQVHRGLAIIVYLFPELQDWLGAIPLRIPLWERTLAVPLAARKLVLLKNVKEPYPPSMAAANSSRAIKEPVGPFRWHVTGGSRRGTSHVRL